MTHDPKALQAHLAAAAPPDLDVTFRAMFGGITAYAEGKPFASLSNIGLALKLDKTAFADLLAIPGAEPLQYDDSQPVSKSYVVVPETLLNDKAALRVWIMRSVTNLPVAKPKKAKPT